MKSKDYYDIFLEKALIPDEIKKIAEEMGINERIFRQKAAYYNSYGATGEERKRYKDIIEKIRPLVKHNISQYYPLIKDILREKNPAVISKMIEESEVSALEDFNFLVTNYILNLNSNISEEYKEKVTGKLHGVAENYRQLLQSRETKVKHVDYHEIKKEQNKIDALNKMKEATLLLNDIAKSEYQTSIEYLNINNIDYKLYEHYLTITKRDQPELFKSYCFTMINKMSDKSLGKEDLLSLIDKINNGVDGRPFDVLDYYSNSKVPIDELLKLTINWDSNNYRSLVINLKKYSFKNKINMEKLIQRNDRIVVGNDIIIPTSEDYYNSYQYLIDNDLPEEYSVLMAVLLRVTLKKDKKM